MRIVQRLVIGEWQDCEFGELKKGDVFRMFEPDGYAVSNSLGDRDFQAESNPYINEIGHWEIWTEDSLIQA